MLRVRALAVVLGLLLIVIVGATLAGDAVQAAPTGSSVAGCVPAQDCGHAVRFLAASGAAAGAGVVCAAHGVRRWCPPRPRRVRPRGHARRIRRLRRRGAVEMDGALPRSHRDRSARRRTPVPAPAPRLLVLLAPASRARTRTGRRTRERRHRVVVPRAVGCRR